MLKRLFIILSIILFATLAFAAKTHIIWTTFSSGELSPLLDGQINFDKYYTGVKTLENFLPRPQGPVSNRPGFKYIAGTKTNTAKSRLVPFIFSDEQAYVLEFGDQYIRFFRDGGQIQSVDTNFGLLIHANEADATAGTNIIDSSPSVHTLTAAGNAQTDEDFKKFGNASLMLDGTGDYLTTPDNTDFTITDEDYAVDAWVRPQQGTMPYSIYSQRTNANNWVKLYLNTNTSLLLHGDGTDGSTTFDDDSPTDHTMTPVGNVQIDTSQSKFGGSSILFDGTGDYLTAADSTDWDFGSSELTINAWIRFNNIPTSGNFAIFVTQVQSIAARWLFFFDGDNGLRFTEVGGTNVALSQGDITGWVVDTWYHIEVVRSGNNWAIYRDGISLDTETNAGTMATLAGGFAVGTHDIGAGATSFMDGWIDDLRILKGKGIHTSNFTVPSLPYKPLHPSLDLRIAAVTETLAPDLTEDESIDWDTWSHVQIDADGTKHYLFSNGQLQNAGGTNLSNVPVDFTQAVHVGAHHNNVTIDSDFKGWIDELRFYKVGEQTTDFIPNTSEYGTIGSSPLELTTNVDYLEKDLFQLQFAQSADTLYIAHKDYPPRKLLRITDTVWALRDIIFFPEPFIRQHVDLETSLSLAQKEVGAGITFTAGSAVFKSGDRGRIIRENPNSGDGSAKIKTFTDTTHVDCDIFQEFSGTSLDSSDWSVIGNSQTATLTLPSATVEIGDVITGTASENVFETSDVGSYISAEAVKVDTSVSLLFKIISVTNATTVSLVAMVFGDASGTIEELKGIKKHEEAQAPCVIGISSGVVQVTGELQPCTLDKTFDVKTAILTSAIIGASDWDITETMWDSVKGFPSALTFFENRLLWAGSSSYPQTIWGSVVDDYENHLGGTNDSDAYQFTLAGSQVNNIRWLDSSDVLLIGTTGAEWILGIRGASTPTTPTNVNARIQTAHGSAEVQPVNVGQSVLFLQKGREKIRELVFDFNLDRHDAPNLTILSEHITDGGILEMDYQEDPVPTGWFIRNDGVLLSMTLLREQNVIGWGRHITDGSFESVAVIPGENGDELWTIVNRTIGGATKRYVERMNPIYDDTTLDSDIAFFVDSGLLYSGVLTSTISGLDHLEGETLSVLADGVVFDDAIVSSGSITLKLATVTTEAERVSTGLPFTSTLQTMRIEQKDTKGTAQGRTKRINRVVFRVDKTKQFQYGQIPTGTLKTHTFDSLYSGDQEVDFVMGNTREGYVSIVNSEPLPITVSAIIPEMNLN